MAVDFTHLDRLFPAMRDSAERWITWALTQDSSVWPELLPPFVVGLLRRAEAAERALEIATGARKPRDASDLLAAFLIAMGHSEAEVAEKRTHVSFIGATEWQKMLEALETAIAQT